MLVVLSKSYNHPCSLVFRDHLRLAYTAKQRADRLSGFEFTEEAPVTEVEQEIPDVGVDSQVDDSTVLEGDELPILTPPSPGVEETSDSEGSLNTDEEAVPQ